MPLRDHFHAPWTNENYWESFHDAWINTLVRHLNGGLLPTRYRALPQVHLGVHAAPDVSTMEKVAAGASEGNEQGAATEVWAPAQPTQTLAVTFPDQDMFELRVYDEARGLRLVGAVELVSPSNKDRPENREAFVVKCASYLQQQVGLVVVDVVTTRRVNFHKQLQRFLASTEPVSALGDLYAAAYRTHAGQGANGRLETWTASLKIGQPLPTLPLGLRDGPVIPIDLEKSYQETCVVLRVD